MRSILCALTFVALIGAAAPQAQSAEIVGKLGMWVGRWTFSGQIYETPYSHAHPDTGVADCTWSANKGYVMCEYFSDNPPHDDLGILSYSASAKAFTHVTVHQDSPPTTSSMTQSGNTWIALSNTSDSGKTLVFRTTFVFLTPDKQTTKVEVSADNGRTWSTMIEVTASKSAQGQEASRPAQS